MRRRIGRARLTRTGAALLAALLALAGLAACGPTSTTGSTAGKGVVRVAYAGSLVNLMEHSVGPAFEHATGYGFEGTGAGSTALANQIKGKLLAPDVFISASASAYRPLEGAANGNIVRWHLNVAATAMVVGYSPHSPFAAQLEAAAQGKTPWYTVLQTPGLRLGRTDPSLDPKGVNTLFVMQLAERYYAQPGLGARVLGADNNPAQIFPEEQLVARLTSGQLDAGFFYLNEVKAVGLPYITLPPQVNLSDPAQQAYYAQARYTTASGQTITGAPVLYSLTIPATVRNEAGALAFVRYLLGSAGQNALHADGILSIPVTASGDIAAVPAALRPYVTAS